MNCFIIMPFKSEFDDVYANIQSVIKDAIPGEKIECIRLDDIKQTSKISDDLLNHINHSSICIADLTDNNPNVMWEVGYAMALGKPLILITQNVSQMPFDLRDIRAIQYDRGSLSKTLNAKLLDAFRATIGSYEERIRSHKVSPPPKKGFSIAITGSMRADPAKCHRRIQALLSDHLGENTTWYCGSYGTADQIAINYLSEYKQKLVIVGYHAFDISPEILNIMENNKIDFIDASKEQLPRGLKGATDRDLLYAMKADLLIVLWDGKSSGTRDLIDWYKTQKKDILIGFV